MVFASAKHGQTLHTDQIKVQHPTPFLIIIDCLSKQPKTPKTGIETDGENASEGQRARESARGSTLIEANNGRK